MTTDIKNSSIRTLSQYDNSSFLITWSDGVAQLFLLADLQSRCPCAQCCEARDRGESTEPSSTPKVRRISNVGRYALRVEFLTGCSNGIFDFDYLRTIGRAPVAG